MGELVDAHVGDGFAKDNELLAHLIGIVDPFAAMKPHEVDEVAAVGEVAHDAFVASFAKLLVSRDMSLDLNDRHVARQLADGVDL